MYRPTVYKLQYCEIMIMNFRVIYAGFLVHFFLICYNNLKQKGKKLIIKQNTKFASNFSWSPVISKDNDTVLRNSIRYFVKHVNFYSTEQNYFWPRGEISKAGYSEKKLTEYPKVVVYDSQLNQI